jgi:hypothetical protein
LRSKPQEPVGPKGMRKHVGFLQNVPVGEERGGTLCPPPRSSQPRFLPQKRRAKQSSRVGPEPLPFNLPPPTRCRGGERVKRFFELAPQPQGTPTGSFTAKHTRCELAKLTRSPPLHRVGGGRLKGCCARRDGVKLRFSMRSPSG